MKIRNLIFLLIILLAIFTMLIAVAELPPYGSPDNPVHNMVTERYINKALEETGVNNIVTAIVLDYRAYDTLFETIVLFTAAIAVYVTLKKAKGSEGGE
ncbi:MAG: hydrogen gas-evolving membrane-bound hydrogenase subunit E [Halanaerobiales bacterium]